MQRNRVITLESTEDHRRGLFDPDPEAEADHWFLPPPNDDAEDVPGPGPKAHQRRLFDPQPWQAAQGRHSGALADLTGLFGALDERLRAGPEGWRHRLALLEVADLNWWTGERIPMDRLALWVGLRLGATGEDAQAVIRAGWAVRRLASGPGPSVGGWESGVQAFLGRAGPGDAAPDTVKDLADIMEQAGLLHAVTQSAMAFHGWRMLGQGGAGIGRTGTGGAADVEAAVMAARHGAASGRGGALFLPLALSGAGALRAVGTEDVRLAAWIAGATQATLAALLHLDRLRDWEVRARDACADLSGRTPPALIAALTAWPMISAPLAETITGGSRAAVQRNLDTLAARGLVREVTGQGRYRVWAARV